MPQLAKAAIILESSSLENSVLVVSVVFATPPVSPTRLLISSALIVAKTLVANNGLNVARLSATLFISALNGSNPKRSRNSFVVNT